MTSTNIFTLVVITIFRSVSGGEIFSIDLEIENKLSVDDFCPVQSNMTMTPISFVDVPRKPGDICREKCQHYHRCSAIGKHPTFLYGGVDAAKKEFPHMALVGCMRESEIDWNCGGSLISENFVLTAAHCLKDNNGNVMMVRLGFTSVKHTKYYQDLYVDDIILHPKYKKDLMYHDIGLLRLSSTIYFNDYIKPICLHLEEDAYLLREPLIVTGWGELYKDSGNKRPENLQKAELEFWDHETCNNIYKRKGKEMYYSKIKHGVLKEIMICAGFSTSTKNPCKGDSGGPLQVRNGDTYVLVGVVSYGKACNLGKHPSIYTRVSHYLQWIVEHVWPETVSVHML